MGKWRALLYPLTYPRQVTLSCLAQVFDSVSILLPAEDAAVPFSSSQETPPLEIIPFVPAPLGDRLAWFREVVRDWESWARDMGLGQGVSAASLLHSAAEESEGSVQSIVAALRGNIERAPLLESRLLLTLAHNLDQHEADLEEDLTALTVKEGQLQELIRGRDSEPEVEWASSGKTGPSLATPVLSEERVRAWARLWAAGAPAGGWPVGEGIVVKDVLDEAYESLQPGFVAVDLLHLPLPEERHLRPGREPSIRELLAQLLELLPSTKGDDLAPGGVAQDLAKAVDSAWKEVVGGVTGGPTLVLTAYLNCQWSTVLAKGAGMDLSTPQAGETGCSFFLV